VRLVRTVPHGARRWVKDRVPKRVWRHMRRLGHGQTLPQRGLRRVSSAARAVTQAGVSNGAKLTTLDGHVYVATPVDRFRSSEVLAEHLSFVAEALDEHQVPYFVLDAQAERRRVVVVTEDHRREALEALAGLGSRGAIYGARLRGNDVRFPKRLGHAGIGRRAKVVRVFRVLVNETGGFLAGPQLGCDVEFWSVTRLDRSAPDNGEPVPAGTWIASRPNRWTDIVTPAEQEVVPRPVDGRTMPRLSTITRPHVLSVKHPIDVVYTWVDGSDPDWILRKAAAQEEHLTRAQVLHDLAANDSRFTSRDELRYSLRSLDMYADWVRHIYLVTDDQVPAWLDCDNDRLTVVSHRELFRDRGLLPTFNSHAIESQLHHVEGLSEHFLYLNDDVFFGRPVSPSLFFHGNGLAIFALSKAKVGLGGPSSEDMPVMSAAKNNRDLLAERFGVTVTNKFQHVPHALRRSVMEDLEREFADEFKRTARAQFRSHEDISPASSLAHYYGYITGRAVPGSLRYFYADIARDDTADRLLGLLQYRDYDVFCLNDHDSSTSDAARQAKVLSDFLEAYYPMPSSFERPGPTV
jgi:hypothetical protein